jgi:Bacterial membrane protein YfhO
MVQKIKYHFMQLTQGFNSFFALGFDVNMQNERSNSYIKAVLILCIAWLVLISPWLTGAATIPYDAKAHFQAQIQFLAQAIHNGDTPFWAPNIFAGSPQIADPQSMIFSPAILLALFNKNPSFMAVDIMMFTYILMGAIGIMMFFKDRGWHSAGAIVAALAFGFGASASSRIQHFGQIHSLALFALTLWLLSRALDRRSIIYGILSGLMAGLMVVAPDQVAFLGVIFLAGFVAHHFLSSQNIKTALTGSIKPLLAGTISATMLAGVPIIMTYLFVESSTRSVVEFSGVVGGSLHPASMLTTIIGDLYGAVDQMVDYWGPGSASWGDKNIYLAQNMGQLYVGALPIAAILGFGVFTGDVFRSEIRYFTIALALSIIYAIGRFTPFFHLFYEYIPGVNLFRRPADATFMVGVFLSILGGYIVHRQINFGFERTKKLNIITGILTIIMLVGTAVLLAFLQAHFLEALKPILLSCIFLSFAIISLAFMPSRFSRANPFLISVLLAIFMVADMRINQGPNESTALSPKEFEPLDPQGANETVQMIKAQIRMGAKPDRRDRVEMVGLGFYWPNVGLVQGFDTTLGYNPLRIAEFSQATGASDIVVGPQDRVFTPLFPSYKSLMADMLGLRLIICGIPIEKVDSSLKAGDLIPLGRTKDGYLYENPRALPRAMFVNNWQIADFDELLKTGKWPQFNPRQTVLLDAPPEKNEVKSTKAAKSQVVIDTYRNGRIELIVTSDQAGFLVLNDSYHPWWYAQVDETPVDVMKANVIFRAVQVPAGKHKVVFEFRPLDGAATELKDKLEGDEAANKIEPLNKTEIQMPKMEAAQ